MDADFLVEGQIGWKDVFLAFHDGKGRGQIFMFTPTEYLKFQK